MRSTTEPTDEATGRSVRLMDLIALTSGYALAAFLFRSFWPSGANVSLGETALLVLVYSWLGLSMSGPLVLLLDRRLPMPGPALPTADDRPPPGRGREPWAEPGQPSSRTSRYTRAELAWMSIGAYWIGMAIFLIPIRVSQTPLALLLVLQTLAVVGLWAVVPRARPASESGWTHRAAIAMLASWPIAWAALIVLARSR